MKNLNITFLPDLDSVEIEKAGRILIENSETHEISTINWPEVFSYKPETKFNIAHTDHAIWIHFRVTEKNVKAVHLTDQQNVWKDSCVEFFVQSPQDTRYINFEFNCIGTCLSTRRKSRDEDVIPLSPDEMQAIERYSSLGRQKLTLAGNTSWELTVKIPFKILGLSDVAGTTLLGNFYKCGDETETPHYVSWSEIHTEQPDFHQPEYFGILHF